MHGFEQDSNNECVCQSLRHLSGGNCVCDDGYTEVNGVCLACYAYCKTC